MRIFQILEFNQFNTGSVHQMFQAAAGLRAARPTAVNLAWAIDRMLRVAESTQDPAALPRRLLDAAAALARADVEANRRIGEHGAALISHGARVLTYCNTGMLATANRPRTIIRSASTITA